ncbi:MAG: extracellular solute-binding protein [Clostridia bacterium]|nr:extracellular solute-binding protein [Clostridia bacterium]
MKKLIAMILALVMVLSMVSIAMADSLADYGFHESGMPIVEKEITLRGVAKQGANVGDFNGMMFFDEMGKLTNVHIEWEMIPSDAWNEKIGLMLATGTDLPDIFYGHGCLTTDKVVEYGNQGYFVDMKPYVEKYGENLKFLTQEVTGLLDAATTPSGAIYALPAVHGIASNANNALFLNKKWLDKLGLDVPTTTEQFVEVLRAFKNGGDLNENGLDDEIPYSYLPGDSVNGIYPMFGAFGRVDNGNHLVTENGKVVFTAREPEYKEAIKWYHQLAEEGLLDQECYSQNVSMLWSKIQQENPNVGCASFWTAQWATGAATIEEANETWVPVAPLISSAGVQLWEQLDTSVYNMCAFAITTACKYPEIAFRWGDYQYSVDAARDCNFGPLGVCVKQNEDGSYQWVEEIDGEPLTSNLIRSKYAPMNYGIFANPPSRWIFEYNSFGATENEKNIELNGKVYGPYQTANYFPTMYQTDEEVEVISNLKTEINSLVAEKAAKWIMDGGVDEEWDAYLEQLKAIGIDEYVNAYQSAYSRYIGQ